ncbi:MAG: hypothetical protein ABIL45_03655 [candidate division WOR-3 bacterium]
MYISLVKTLKGRGIFFEVGFLNGINNYFYLRDKNFLINQIFVNFENLFVAELLNRFHKTKNFSLSLFMLSDLFKNFSFMKNLFEFIFLYNRQNYISEIYFKNQNLTKMNKKKRFIYSFFSYLKFFIDLKRNDIDGAFPDIDNLEKEKCDLLLIFSKKKNYIKVEKSYFQYFDFSIFFDDYSKIILTASMKGIEFCKKNKIIQLDKVYYYL